MIWYLMKRNMKSLFWIIILVKVLWELKRKPHTDQTLNPISAFNLKLGIEERKVEKQRKEKHSEILSKTIVWNIGNNWLPQKKSLSFLEKNIVFYVLKRKLLKRLLTYLNWKSKRLNIVTSAVYEIYKRVW